MGHFTIQLPENKTGDVRFGTVSKKMLFPFFRKNKIESKRGYIVIVSDDKSKTHYRLFKSSNGEWSKDPDGTDQLDVDLIPLKNAILEKEKDLNLH